MTEGKWLKCRDHLAMLDYLRARGAGGFRKYRLLVAAYCRCFLPALFTDERVAAVVDVAEAYADGAAKKAELKRAERSALRAVEDIRAVQTVRRLELACRLDDAVRGVAYGRPERTAVELPHSCLRPRQRNGFYNPPTPAQGRRLGQLIRDIFANPFRPAPAVEPAWLAWQGGAVRELARAAYDDRRLPDGTLDAGRLGVLADALEDAGCADHDLLGHLRAPAPHVRGCWALDLLLGKG